MVQMIRLEFEEIWVVRTSRDAVCSEVSLERKVAPEVHLQAVHGFSRSGTLRTRTGTVRELALLAEDARAL